jgi:energy-coupling factor transporter ATP-binding protein EcfA2
MERNEAISVRDLPNSELRSEGRDQLFEQLLEEVLGGELGELAVNNGLRLERLREDAAVVRAEILADARPAWRALRHARSEQWQLSVRRMRGEDARSYFRRLLLRLLDNELPAALGFFATSLGLVVLAVQFAGLSALFGVPLTVIALLAITVWFRSSFTTFFEGADFEVARERAEAVAEAYATQLRDAGISSWLRETINEAEEASYSTELRFGDRSGLAEIDDPRHEVPTHAKEDVLALVDDEAMPGGAIGVAGSRGAGKTTLIRSLCASSEDSDEVLGVVVDAPVDYDPRDFVLHLFGKVCSAVVGPEVVGRVRGSAEFLGGVRSKAPSLLQLPFLGGLALMVIGALLLAEWFPANEPRGRNLLLIAAFATFIPGFVVAMLQLVRSGPERRRRRTTRHLIETGTKDGQTAMVELQRIWFQRSFTSGWSGSFQTPLGLSGTQSNETGLAERQMNFPEIVEAFRGFLEQISQTRQVRIGIDELDKMDDETARRFLNEIKVVFRVPGCFFFISISEDAMGYFERRGLPVRDVFDSSFDEVVRVPPLGLVESRSLLARRVVGLPLPFICLAHCLAGGLPRDLIRVTRKMVNIPEGTSIGDAAVRMSGEGFAAKLNGVRLAVRKFAPGPATRILNRALDGLMIAAADTEALFDACVGAERGFVEELGRGHGERRSPEEEELLVLGQQIGAAAYLAVTQREIFAQAESRATFDLITADGPGGSGVDQLAAIPERLAADLDSGWAAISALRVEFDLLSIRFPTGEDDDPAAASTFGAPEPVG